ncbi:U4/U6 small nuclear ribonucleoprotein prp4 [Rhodotorula kratochvilovae]
MSSHPRDNARRSRARPEDDDGALPWWEHDRRGPQSRGFDDEQPQRRAASYYDRDAAPDERDHRGGGGRGYGGGRGGGAGGGGYARDGYDRRGSDARRYDGGGARGYYDRDRDAGRDDHDQGGRSRRDSQGQDARPPPRRTSIPPPVPPAQQPQAPPPAPAAPAEPAAPTAADVEEGEINPALEPELDLTPVAEPDPEAILAERRRKRAEILAKYAGAASNIPAAAPSGGATPDVKREAPDEETVGTPGREQVERAAKRLRIGTDSPAISSNEPSTRAVSVDPLAESSFSLTKDAASSSAASGAPAASAGQTDAEEVSAADYDPDGADDDRRQRRELEREREEKDREGVIEVAESAEEGDEDDDDEDDMFAIGVEEKKPKTKTGRKKKAGVPIVNRGLPTGTTDASLLADNYDDAEGYYRVILGEALDEGRYHVVANLGKGMFSSVVKARDLGEKGSGKYEGEPGLAGRGVGEGERRDVAIKIVRSQESMFKAGMKEAQILRRLRDADPDDKKHLVRLHRTFEHRGHLCLVFESLSMNLREVVKRYGKDVGLNLRAVRAYASQMFLALALMRKCEIMHADLKPDNILVNESKSTLKVCDLGSASDVSENEITPYLVSRFYRAPEIILGLPYDCSLDVWSIACTLYELYTGKILFPGRTNNHMLLLIMETKGKFNHKLIRKARFHDQHFDENLNFLYVEKSDTVTARQIPGKPPSDLRSRLMPPGLTRKLKEDEVRLLTSFVDLLDKMLSLEPGRRPTPKELLSHPFIRG